MSRSENVVARVLENGREGLTPQLNSNTIAEKKIAYIFDGEGAVFEKEWVLAEGTGNELCWYHVQLNSGRDMEFDEVALCLIEILRPLKVPLPEILSLVTDGCFCRMFDTALVFRLNVPGPTSSKFVSRFSARIAKNSVITIALGEIRRLDFSSMQSVQSELASIQIPENPDEGTKSRLKNLFNSFPYLESHLITAPRPPTSVFGLVLHVVNAYVDHIRDRITELETELDSIEIELDKGDFAFKKQMAYDRTLQNMNMNLQHLIQAIAFGELVFHRKNIFSEGIFSDSDPTELEEIKGRLRLLKEYADFKSNRVKAILATLDSFKADLDRRQAEKINKKLYIIQIFSGVLLPLSIITGVFGMHVRGVPWTNPNGVNGFFIVMIIIGVCIAMMFLGMLGTFIMPKIYARVSLRLRGRTSRFSGNGRLLQV